MKTDQGGRAKKSIVNVFTGVVLVAFMTVMTFAIRTVMIYTIGTEYLGLTNLFMSIMQVLNVSELGIGSVMVFFLYAPAAAGDKAKIDAYMKALHDIYVGIGVFILVVGLALTPFLKHFISGEMPPDANIYFLFVLYLICSVIQYFMYPEEVVLIEAYQRKDLSNIITLIANVSSYVMQIIVLYCFHNFMLFIAAVGLRSVLNGVMRKYYGVKYFNEYRPQGNISVEEKRDIRVKVSSIIGHQIDEQLFNSIDTVFISAIIGLSAVTIYSNYFCVIKAVTLLASNVFKAILPSVGNAVAVETKESNYKRFLNVFWLGACFAGWTTICMIIIYQNFMYLWMGSKQMLGLDMVILFCLYSYLSQIRRTVTMFKDAAGMWWNDRYKPYISMAVDLILDAVLIRFMGLKGAIISSILCLAVIEIPWETKILFRDYFQRSERTYIIRNIVYGLINFAVLIAAFLFSEKVTSGTTGVSLVIRVLICCASGVVLLIPYLRTEEFRSWKNTFMNMRHKPISD